MTYHLLILQNCNLTFHHAPFLYNYTCTNKWLYRMFFLWNWSLNIFRWSLSKCKMGKYHKGQGYYSKCAKWKTGKTHYYYAKVTQSKTWPIHLLPTKTKNNILVTVLDLWYYLLFRTYSKWWRNWTVSWLWW